MAAAVVAVAGGGVAAGAAIKPALVEAVAKTNNMAADETIETEVVVVGSGLGGLSAAMTAAEEGAKRVVVLEKEEMFGGGTNWAECNGPGQATEAQARQSALMSMRSSNYMADPMLHYYLALNKKDDSDWLFVKHQVKTQSSGSVGDPGENTAAESEPSPAAETAGPGGGQAGAQAEGPGGGPGEGPSGSPTGGFPGGGEGGPGGSPSGAPGGNQREGQAGGQGGGPGRGGRMFYAGGHGLSCIQTLIPQAKTLGIDLRLKTQALSLIMKDPYTCVGIRAKSKDGKIIDFKAKAVVLATGGMSTNKTRLAEYTSIDLEKVLIDGPKSGQDGDGHKMVEATAHGKATHLCVASLFLNVKGFAYSSPLGTCAGMQPSNLWVNQDGIRFTSEDVVSSNTAANKAVEIQGSVFSIMDQAGFDKYAAGGCQTHYSGFSDVLVGKPIPHLAAEFEKCKNLPDVFYAQTLEELARKMGIDVAAFNATVERYNGYVQSGKDTEWGKKVSNIWPIAKAPFYGFRLSSGMLNTCGGVRINTNAQVVDPRYRVISGLYATGILTSGWEGEIYMGGTCQPVALWGGRRAAKHIAANLL
jgi:succinate dehydrogenase/fumarate reductase flavoprotein subunit